MKHMLMLGGGLLASSLALAAPPRDVDGSWYSPVQSGHGLTIERIDADHALVFWHVFDPEGQPLTLYIETSIDGNILAGEAYAPGGMRFGSFDPAEFVLPQWGTIQIEFTDCQNATLHYDGALPGYGSGDINLIRLLPLPQTDCALDRPADATSFAGARVAGRLEGSLVGDGIAVDVRGDMEGIVDEQGQLWLAAPYASPAPEADFVVVAEPSGGVPGRPRFNATAYENGWLDPFRPRAGANPGAAPLRGNFEFSLDGRPQRIAGYLFEDGSNAWEGRLETQPRIAAEPLRAATYAITASVPGDTWQLQVRSDRSLCVLKVELLARCRMQGRITADLDDYFEFELQDSFGDRPMFRGVGRAIYQVDLLGFGAAPALRMTAHNGQTGLQITLPQPRP